MALHDSQHLDNDLRARPDHDLAFSSLLGIVDAIESIVEDGCADHLVGGRRRGGDSQVVGKSLEMRYLPK
jgi:hypothetical protein